MRRKHRKNFVYLSVRYIAKPGEAPKNGIDGYRFGFNGIEKVNEVAGTGNHYTALFGEYDPRIAYRWNTDPKPAFGWSPYSMFGANPIWYSDPLLDVLKISNGTNASQETKDIQSLPANSANSKYVKVDPKDGNVTLDFGDMSKEDQINMVNGDKGLSLLSNMIYTKDANGNDYNFMYEVGNKSTGVDRISGNKVPLNFSIDKSVTSGSKYDNDVINLSVTPWNIGGTGNQTGLKPDKGLSGYVRLSPGNWSMSTNPKTNIKRASMVFHELAENMYRTIYKQPYMRKDGTGAHQSSQQLEGQSYGNPTPGKIHDYVP